MYPQSKRCSLPSLPSFPQPHLFGSTYCVSEAAQGGEGWQKGVLLGKLCSIPGPPPKCRLWLVPRGCSELMVVVEVTAKNTDRQGAPHLRFSSAGCAVSVASVKALPPALFTCSPVCSCVWVQELSGAPCLPQKRSSWFCLLELLDWKTE